MCDAPTVRTLLDRREAAVKSLVTAWSCVDVACLADMAILASSATPGRCRRTGENRGVRSGWSRGNISKSRRMPQSRLSGLRRVHEHP